MNCSQTLSFVIKSGDSQASHSWCQSLWAQVEFWEVGKGRKHDKKKGKYIMKEEVTHYGEVSCFSTVFSHHILHIVSPTETRLWQLNANACETCKHADNTQVLKNALSIQHLVSTLGSNTTKKLLKWVNTVQVLNLHCISSLWRVCRQEISKIYRLHCLYPEFLRCL